MSACVTPVSQSVLSLTPVFIKALSGDSSYISDIY